MLYVPEADMAQKADRRRRQREIRRKAFVKLQNEARHLGYKLVKHKSLQDQTLDELYDV